MMGKLEYLDALKRAMLGLAPEIQAKTLAWYEQRFVDGVAAGRSEQEIAEELGDPKKVAVTLRANTHLNAFVEKKNPANFARLLVSGAGLLVFNLFLVVPAAVYAALLAALYACALAFYVAGIAITASGLSGADELVLGGPWRHVSVNGDGAVQENTRITIDETGVHVQREKAPAADPDADLEVDVSGGEPSDGEPSRPGVLDRAEAAAERGIKITTDMDADSRTTQTLLGLGMVLGGIALFLLALVVTRYTVIGIKRYAKMNLSLLKGS
jgi:uncharacterized membrane protein